MKKITLQKTIPLFLFFVLFHLGKVSAQLTPTVTVTNATNCTPPSCDGSATTNDVTALGGTYLWSDPQGQTSMTATGLCPGTYSVTITVPIVGSAVGTGTVVCVAGVNEYELNNLLEIFPNPATSEISIQMLSQNGGEVSEISIINSIGEKVLSEKFNSSNRFNNTFFIGNLPKGLYFVELKNEKNTYWQKFTKE